MRKLYVLICDDCHKEWDDIPPEIDASRKCPQCDKSLRQLWVHVPSVQFNGWFPGEDAKRAKLQANDRAACDKKCKEENREIIKRDANEVTKAVLNGQL